HQKHLVPPYNIIQLTICNIIIITIIITTAIAIIIIIIIINIIINCGGVLQRQELRNWFSCLFRHRPFKI
ncbi:hypothetical protein, partial [Thiolapillus sp.]|uniref:hypothetical protein n=1 Tax=Thiolapillus sp. TaxID=2017437 RepID=UPI0025FDA53F